MQATSLNPSFWTQTAAPAHQGSSLEGENHCDVTIIGAGITGLRAALELSQCGVSVSVLDSAEPGFGASGRTGGQVNPLAHTTPEKIIQQLGPTFGPRMLECYINSADELFGLIDKHQLQCEAQQKGWIRAAHCHTAVGELESMQRSWEKYGLSIKSLSSQQLHRLSGSKRYQDAIELSAGGYIQPLSYTRELARVASHYGANIHCHSRVEKVEAQGQQWRVKTADASMTSQWVLFCTNGYTDNTLRGLRKSVIPLVSVQAVTRELSDSEYAAILPQAHTLADTRRVIYYARKDNRNRLLFGSLGADPQCNSSDKKRLQKAIKDVFPQFSAADLTQYWGGQLAFTADLLPHLHEPAPGILAGLGYNGRGVAMATVMGRILAERVQGKAAADLAIASSHIRGFNFHALQRAALPCAIKYFETRDALDIKFNA